MSALPDWLRRHLEDTGQLRADRITRHVSGRRCPACGGPVLAGLTDPPSLAYLADPHPLSPLGEALAVLADRQTLGLWTAGTGYRLSRRDSFAMRTPAGQGRCDVLAEHRCAAPALPGTRSVLRPPTAAAEETTCPF